MSYDVITATKKTRRVNVKLSEALFQTIKKYLRLTNQEGQLSNIIRDLVREKIASEKGKEFIINPEIEQKRLNLKIDDFERQLENLKDAETEITEIIDEKELDVFDETLENKFKLYAEKREIGKKVFQLQENDLWICLICNQADLKPRGLNFHKCKL